MKEFLGQWLWISWKEVRGSNPVIGKFYVKHLFTVNYLSWKDKNKEKRRREWPIL